MARRKYLTDAQISALKPKAKRYALPDPELRGHYVRVTPGGVRTFVAVARAPAGKQVWATIETADRIGIEDAREKAREAIRRIKAGMLPFEPPAPPADSFKAVAENWLLRHARAKALRTADEYERILKVYVYPTWEDREFESIRRGDVARLLDGVQDANGDRQADLVLATVRAIMNWYASRADDYVSPITRGMRRSDPKARQRKRILDDAELRLVWKVAEANGKFGAILRFALLTAQRREKILTMKWSDLTADGVWNIPAEAREKGTGGALELPKAARAIIAGQDVIKGNPYVFAGRGEREFQGISKALENFNAKVAKANGDKPLPHWTPHDLRRTARSLMSRAGVRPDIAERVMGHAIAGVEAIYDRHGYTLEKRDALARLADVIERIVSPPSGNVVALHAEAAQ